MSSYLQNMQFIAGLLHYRPGRAYTLWNYDVQTPKNVNLCESLHNAIQPFGISPLPCVDGSHPFYLEMRKGKAHGVFLRNSNGMDIILNDTSLTYRVIGGQYTQS